MEYHLVKNEGEWQLHKQGSTEPLVSAETKAEAIDRMRDYMYTEGGSVVIHSTNGEIQEHRRYAPTDDNSWTERHLGVTGKSLGIFGVVAVAAVTAACVAFYYRDRLPLERLRLPRL
jgi:hypothetical protein